jgi:cation diffusion facilitator CzcD-associated flavoprotein CzcO
VATTSVAILGGGAAGLLAARYLKSEGMTPTIYDRADRIGGQWSGDTECSGVWPSMRANTSRIMTAFSDLPHAPGTAVYPTNQQVGAYLQRFADEFDLMPHVKLQTDVPQVERAPSGEWVVGFVDADV